MNRSQTQVNGLLRVHLPMEKKMKNIAIIICNYNKKEYVKKNVESLLRQTDRNFDIYVVDNASNDGSEEYLSDCFSDEIVLICNKENLGGSGGFNAGMRRVIGENYKYIMLLDNDIVLAEDCVEQCVSAMERNPDVGMLGCKILKMDYPDRIQEFGPTIDFDKMCFVCNYGGEIDKGQFSYMMDCDYVPACAVMIRQEVIEKIGLMPQENFIYYDDIIWGVRCHRAGYRVAVCSTAKVWHKGGAAINPSTFPTYYLTRNRIQFFMKYMNVEGKNTGITNAEIRLRADKIIKEVFEGIYACNQKGMLNVAKTRMEAFLDALAGKTGKAEEYHIRSRELPDNRFSELMLQKKSIIIRMHGLWEATRRVLFWLNELSDANKCSFKIIVTDDEKYVQSCILGHKIYPDTEIKEADNNTVDINVCEHIYEKKLNIFDRLWIDGWQNVILNEDDFAQQKGFESAYNLFALCFTDIVVNKLENGLEKDE